MGVNELVEICENETSYKTSLKNIKLFFHSFTDNFDYYKKIVEDSKLEVEEEEIKKFIKICDIKVEWAKTLINEVGTVFSFGITIISFAFAVTSYIFSKEKFDVFNISFDDQIVTIILPVVFLAFLLFGILRLHYRRHIHAWTAFKEAAILSKKYTSNGEIEKC